MYCIAQLLYAVTCDASRGHSKNTYELLNPRALKISIFYQNHIFQWARYFGWNFKGSLWNSTQNILPIHWKMWILFTGENLRALRFKSSWMFMKRPLVPYVYRGWRLVNVNCIIFMWMHSLNVWNIACFVRNLYRIHAYNHCNTDVFMFKSWLL